MATAKELTKNGQMFVSGKTTKSGYAAVYRILSGEDAGLFILSVASASGGRTSGLRNIGKGTHRKMKQLRESM